MPPTLQPEEIPTGSPARLTSSKTWVLQVGLLFSLLLLGRGSRPVPAQLATINFPVPALHPRPTPPLLPSAASAAVLEDVAQGKLLNAIPVGYPGGASTAFAEIGL